MASGSGQSLRRNTLGAAAITFFVVSAAAPMTAVAGGFPLTMLFGNGAGVPAVVLALTVLLLIFAIGYTAMARHIANAGSFYAFTARGLGGVAGGAAAYIALIAYNAMQVSLYGLFGAVTGGVLASGGLGFAIDLPWWVWSLICWAIVAFMGYRQIDLSAKVLAVLVIAEYIAVVVLDLMIVGQGGASGISFANFSADYIFPAEGSVSIALLFSFAAFMGFEATTIYSEEARDPKRTVPVATYAAVLLIGLFYAFTTWCMAIGTGIDQLMPTLAGLEDPTAFIFILSDTFAFGGLTWLMQILLFTSLFAALLAFHNAAARYFFVMGREGLLPGHLGTTHDSHQSPHRGSVLQSGIALVVVGIFAVLNMDPVFTLFTWLSNLGTLGLITLMALASFAVVAFFAKNKGLEPSALKSTLAPLVAGVLLALVAFMAAKSFPALTGASTSLSYGLIALIPIAAIVGAVVTNQLKSADAARFAKLGAHQPGG